MKSGFSLSNLLGLFRLYKLFVRTYINKYTTAIKIQWSSAFVKSVGKGIRCGYGRGAKF